jgi:hypothetical protein
MAEVGFGGGGGWCRKTEGDPDAQAQFETPPSHSSSSKTAKQANAAAQTTPHKPVKPKRGTQPQPHPSSARQTERTETKQARILAMLRAPLPTTNSALIGPSHSITNGVRVFGPDSPTPALPVALAVPMSPRRYLGLLLVGRSDLRLVPAQPPIICAQRRLAITLKPPRLRPASRHGW